MAMQVENRDQRRPREPRQQRQTKNPSTSIPVLHSSLLSRRRKAKPPKRNLPARAACASSSMLARIAARQFRPPLSSPFSGARRSDLLMTARLPGEDSVCAIDRALQAISLRYAQARDVELSDVE